MSGSENAAKENLNVRLRDSEGLDMNHASRIRAQYLLVQHQSMIAQSQFADAKAGAILALLGLLALRGPVDAGSGAGTTSWMWYLFLCLTTLSVGFCLLAIMPRYPNRKIRNQAAEVETWSWPSLASDRVNDMDYGSHMRTTEISKLINSVAFANRNIANILLIKFRLLRIAMIMLLATAGVAALNFITNSGT